MRGTLYRLGMSVFIVTYVTVAATGQFRDQPTAQKIYEFLRPLQHSLCLWQNWPMFAPPPSSTSWLVITGKTATGRKVDIEPRFGRLEGDWWVWRYNRYNKLERNTFKRTRKRLRQSFGQWACREQKQRGPEVVSITLWRDRIRTLPPAQRRRDSLPPAKRIRDELQTIPCR